MQHYAMDDLRFIRRTMERAGSFTAVPGIGVIVMGLTALATAWIARGQSEPGGRLAIWLAEAAVALAIGIAGVAIKSRRAGVPVFGGPSRKFLAGFVPPMLAGAVLTAALVLAGVTACRKTGPMTTG